MARNPSGTAKQFKNMKLLAKEIDINGVGVLPTRTSGDIYYVKPNSGSDSNDGKSLDAPFATLSAAHSAMTADQHDTCFLIAESNSASSTSDYQSATLTWSKDLCHLIGVGAPGHFSHRARIAQLSTATGVSPLVNVTADGCYFSNFSIFHGVADATSLVALQVTGERNYFEDCHIAGMGHADMVAANAASLKLTGSENTFKGCTIGLDTISRDASTKGEIWLDGGASRNWFEDCLIDAYISAAGYDHVTVEDTTGIDRGLYFKNCLFMAKSTNKGVTQTQVFAIPAGISQGAIILQDTYAFSDGGAVDWDGGNRGIIWTNNVDAAASAAGGIMTNQ